MKARILTRILGVLTLNILLIATVLAVLARRPTEARAAADDHFVTPGGGGDCSQPSPCDLPAALAAAVDGDGLYLAEGAYQGAGGAVVTVTQSITFYGGWDGSPEGPIVRDPAAYAAVIDGETQRRGVFITAGVTVTLDGLTIAQGFGVEKGGGLYAQDADLTLRGMTFITNVVSGTGYVYGGGAYFGGGALLVEGATFRHNSAWGTFIPNGGGLGIVGPVTATVINSMFEENDAWHAGGLFFIGDSATLSPLRVADCVFVSNGWGYSGSGAFGGYTSALEVIDARAHVEGNVFHDNRAANDYGAVSFFFSDVVLDSNTITGNLAGRVSGLLLNGVPAFTVTNNVIAENRSINTFLTNPAVRVRASSGDFLHNTIAANESVYGVLVDDGSEARLFNTILVSHTVGITVTSDSSATLAAKLWGIGPWANGMDYGGSGTILLGPPFFYGDPDFIDPEQGDYHIGPFSLARDNGLFRGVTRDIDGDTRPLGSEVDIGADEYHLFWSSYLPLIEK